MAQDFSTLPKDVLLEIFNKLNIKDSNSLFSVNSFFNKNLFQKNVWENLSKYYFPCAYAEKIRSRANVDFKKFCTDAYLYQQELLNTLEELKNLDLTDIKITYYVLRQDEYDPNIFYLCFNTDYFFASLYNDYNDEEPPIIQKIKEQVFHQTSIDVNVEKNGLDVEACLEINLKFENDLIAKDVFLGAGLEWIEDNASVSQLSF